MPDSEVLDLTLGFYFQKEKKFTIIDAVEFAIQIKPGPKYPDPIKSGQKQTVFLPLRKTSTDVVALSLV